MTTTNFTRSVSQILFIIIARIRILYVNTYTTSRLPEVLTKFIRNVESRVFAYMNTAPPQELNDNYGVPPSGRPDL